MSVKLGNTQDVIMSRLDVWSCFSYNNSGTDNNSVATVCYLVLSTHVEKYLERI